MPLDEAVLEHQVVGGVPAEEGYAPQVDVIVVAARRDMVSAFLEPMRRAGLEPVGIDLSAFGMIRALAAVAAAALPAESPGADEEPASEADPARAAGAAREAVLYCNVGDAMNLAVARGRSCLFTRASTVGLEEIAARLGADTGLLAEHAGQWLGHVGFEQPLEQVPGDPELVATVRRTLEEGITGLVDELRLSLDYYGAQESAVPVGRILLCGPGSAIPGLAAQMEAVLGLPIATSRPLALADRDEAAAARLTLPFGIALEN